MRALQGAFAENWLEATGDVLVGDEYLPELEPVDGGAPMQVVRSSAGVGDTTSRRCTSSRSPARSESIDLTAAYFAPRPAFSGALCDAAERGVRVRVLVPGPHIDKEFVRVAGPADLRGAARAPASQIFEYQPTMLHAKTLVIDGAWSQRRLGELRQPLVPAHDEATLCVQGDGVRGRAHGAVRAATSSRAERIEPERWRDRSVVQRSRERLVQLARREI